MSFEPKNAEKHKELFFKRNEGCCGSKTLQKLKIETQEGTRRYEEAQENWMWYQLKMNDNLVTN